MKFAWILMLLFAIVGCQAEQSAVPVDIDAIVQELTTAQYAYAEAWSNLDMDTIGEIWSHDDDVTLWGPAERDRVQGWDGPNGVKAWYEAAMEPMAEVDFKIHDLLIKVSDNGDAAVITYYVENDYVDKEGNTGKMTPRVTVVKVIQNGQWKCIFGEATFSIAEINAQNQ